MLYGDREYVMSEVSKDYATALEFTNYCKSLPMNFSVGDSVKVSIKREFIDSQDKRRKAVSRHGRVVEVTSRFIVVEIYGGSEPWRTAFTGFGILQDVERV